jgi:hypothetical protein
MARAGRGRTMMQLPMQCYKYSEWSWVIQERLSDEVEQRMAG